MEKNAHMYDLMDKWDKALNSPEFAKDQQKVDDDKFPDYIANTLLSEAAPASPVTITSRSTAPNHPNPIAPDTLGKDQDLTVVPNFTEGPELKKLTDIKYKLYELECDLNKSDALGEEEKAKKILTQISNAKKELDRLSDLLTPDRFGPS